LKVTLADNMEEFDKIGTEFDIKHLQTINEETPKNGSKASKKLD